MRAIPRINLTLRRSARIALRGNRRTMAVLAAGLLLTGCSGVTDAVDLVRGEPAETSATVDAEEHDEGNDEGEDADSDQAGDTDTGPESGDGAGDDADDASDGATPADELELTTCEAERYTVEAPADWHVNDGARIGDCRIFHPEPVEIPDMPRDRDLHWAIALDVDDVPFEDIDIEAEADAILSSEETSVDGHRALVYERRSAGEGMIPEGERSYLYLVDLDGQTLIASTYAVGDTDYERDKQLLDRMMGSLALTPSERDDPEEVVEHEQGERDFRVTARSIADGACLTVHADDGEDEACGPVDDGLDVRTFEIAGEQYLAGIVNGPITDVAMIANDGSAIAEEHAATELVDILGESGFRAFAPVDGPAMYQAVVGYGPDGEEVARVEL